MLPRWQIDDAITSCTVGDPGEKNWTAIADFEADIVASNGTVYADLVDVILDAVRPPIEIAPTRHHANDEKRHDQKRAEINPVIRHTYPRTISSSREKE